MISLFSSCLSSSWPRPDSIEAPHLSCLVWVFHTQPVCPLSEMQFFLFNTSLTSLGSFQHVFQGFFWRSHCETGHLLVSSFWQSLGYSPSPSMIEFSQQLVWAAELPSSVRRIQDGGHVVGVSSLFSQSGVPGDFILDSKFVLYHLFHYELSIFPSLLIIVFQDAKYLDVVTS